MSENQSFSEKDFEVGLAQYLYFLATEGASAEPTGDLLRWVNYQNACRKKNFEGAKTGLTEERIVVLNHVGFQWKLSNKERWENNYQDLVEYEHLNGDCKVPRGPGLGEWVSTQRKEMKKCSEGKQSSLTDDRIAKLDSIGFEWNLNDWDEKYSQLSVFAQENGHCDVPRRDKKFGRWVSYQRTRYSNLINGKRSTMTDYEIEELEAIGFEWFFEPNEDSTVADAVDKVTV